MHEADRFGMGDAPIKRKACASWRPQFLQHSLVEREELDGYECGQELGGGVWC
jgi:hypothetical protein